MSIGNILYHTVEDRNNIQYIKENAPFLCCRQKAWLGVGYYFWEFINHAHWWGKQVYKGKYYICTSKYIEDQSTILDLHGDAKRIQDFYYGWKMLCEESGKNDLTLPEVITFMKEKLGEAFDYKAIRISSHKCIINKNEIDRYYIPASGKGNDFVELTPRIQICVFDKAFIHVPVGVMNMNSTSFNTNKTY